MLLSWTLYEEPKHQRCSLHPIPNLKGDQNADNSVKTNQYRHDCLAFEDCHCIEQLSCWGQWELLRSRPRSDTNLTLRVPTLPVQHDLTRFPGSQDDPSVCQNFQFAGFFTGPKYNNAYRRPHSLGLSVRAELDIIPSRRLRPLWEGEAQILMFELEAAPNKGRVLAPGPLPPLLGHICMLIWPEKFSAYCMECGPARNRGRISEEYYWLRVVLVCVWGPDCAQFGLGAKGPWWEWGGLWPGWHC